jgi:hypothetical protein
MQCSKEYLPNPNAVLRHRETSNREFNCSSQLLSAELLKQLNETLYMINKELKISAAQLVPQARQGNHREALGIAEQLEKPGLDGTNP